MLPDLNWGMRLPPDGVEPHPISAVTRAHRPLPALLSFLIRPWPRYILKGKTIAEVIYQAHLTCF